MRIGIDARKLGDTGIGTYLEGLLEGLLRQDESIRLVLFLPPGRLGAFGDEGGRVEEVEEPAEKYGLRELSSLSRKARGSRLDLFHAPHYVLPFGLPCPSVVTIHDVIHLLYPKSRFHYLYARLMMWHATRAAERIIAVSEHTKQDLVKLVKADPRKIAVVLNGIGRPARFGVRPAGAVPPEGSPAADPAALIPARPYVLYVGGLKPHKNVEALIVAFGSQAVGSEAAAGHDLVVCGADAERAGALGALAAKTGVGGRVHFPGFVSAAALDRLYLGASLFVFPSLYEGFGFPPLEAMARGVPVVCSNRASLPEVVGDAALLVDPEDASALADAIARGLRDEGLRLDLTRRGLARTVQLKWADAARATLATYREVLAGKKG